MCGCRRESRADFTYGQGEVMRTGARRFLTRQQQAHSQHARNPVLDETMRAAVRALAECCFVAAVTGRGLADVRAGRPAT